MKWSLSFLIMSVALFLLIGSSNGAIMITSRQNNHPRLKSIDESIVYKALTVIEGDILVDKYCECQSERLCRVQKRSIIVLTQWEHTFKKNFHSKLTANNFSENNAKVKEIFAASWIFNPEPMIFDVPFATQKEKNKKCFFFCKPFSFSFSTSLKSNLELERSDEAGMPFDDVNLIDDFS